MPKLTENAVKDRENYDLVKSLYISGCTPNEIADRLQIKPQKIKCWAHRGDWITLRTGVAKVVRTRGAKAANLDSNLSFRDTSTGVSRSTDERSVLVKALLSKDLEAQARILANAPPVSIVELQTDKIRQGRSQTIRHIADAAGKVFGWDQAQTPTTLIQVGEINQLAPDQAQGETVDVEALSTSEVGEVSNPDTESELDRLRRENQELKASVEQALTEAERLAELIPTTPQ